jgi:hypothetical protein
LKKKHHQISNFNGWRFSNELRSLSDARFFEFSIMDDGEVPIEELISNIEKSS